MKTYLWQQKYRWERNDRYTTIQQFDNLEDALNAKDDFLKHNISLNIVNRVIEGVSND